MIEAIVATHYCPQRTQPRMTLGQGYPKILHFSFRDATDLDRASEAHQHDLWFDVTALDRSIRSEVYFSPGQPGAREDTALVRVQ